MTKWFVKSSGLKSFRVPVESLVLGLSASSMSMENAAVAGRVKCTVVTMALHNCFVREQDDRIYNYLPSCAAQCLWQQPSGAMLNARSGVPFVYMMAAGGASCAAKSL